MATTILKHGAVWAAGTSDLDIEIACIRKGGKWKNKAGVEVGSGLFEHYRALQDLIWPHLDRHRWSNLCLREQVQNKVTVLMGAASCGKTHEAAKFALSYYYCWPQETIVLISSTDLRGLELRVWGEIKMLHESALSRFPQLPGELLESKHAISTDSIEEDGDVRDLRKGIIGIPCVQGGKWVGLGKYCIFPGTLVDTPTGQASIESIRNGDFVMSAIGPRRVIAIANHIAPKVVTVHLSTGESIVCTPNHQFLTSNGWENASCILPETKLYSTHETMQIMREGFTKTRETVLQPTMPKGAMEEGLSLVQEIVHPIGEKGDFLFSILRGELEDEPSGNCQTDDCWEGFDCDRESNQRWDNEKQTRPKETKNSREKSVQLRNELGSSEQPFANPFGGYSAGGVPECNPQLQSENRKEFSPPRSPSLQNRPCLAGSEFSSGGGRQLPRPRNSKNEGHEKGRVLEIVRVVRVEVHEPSSDPKYCQSEGGYRVFNLQVEGHPSYSVHGCVTHNCGIKQKRVLLIADEAQFCSSSFLSAFSNLDKNEVFQATVLGNPNDVLDPLGRAAEPLDGWTAHMEPEKTECWNTRFMNGRCVNLIGTDSPNFDYPADQPARYPYLISRQKIESTAAFFGKDTLEYSSQCIGSMRVATMSRRVVTSDLCRQFSASEPPTWSGGRRTRIYAVDAAYGGDRCVGGYVEFGEVIGGKIVVHVPRPKIIPISVRSGESPEDQISKYVKTDCENEDIPPENMFHDATGRGSLGTALAREWSAMTNPVEFGGSPTKRPVSLDMFVMDPQTHARRLKTCAEHYSKFVTELWFSIRYLIEAGQMAGLPSEVIEELCMREWNKVAGDRIEVETKVEMKKRAGRSPDLADWLAIAIEGCRRRGLQINKLASEADEGPKWSWLRDLESKRSKLAARHQLTYA